MKGYSTRDVAELLEIPPGVIRDIARSGILEPARTPGNHYRFNFQDIIIRMTKAVMNVVNMRMIDVDESEMTSSN